MKKIITEYTQYNRWANGKMCSFLEALSDAQLDMEQKSSFASIRKTAEHIADCEYNWLKRINGNSNWEDKAGKFQGDAKMLSQFWLDQSSEFVNVAEQNSEESLQKIIPYKNMKGVPFQNELYKIIMHVMNHATYHRGQLVTMLRGTGSTDLPSTDLIVFYRL